MTVINLATARKKRRAAAQKVARARAGEMLDALARIHADIIEGIETLDAYLDREDTLVARSALDAIGAAALLEARDMLSSDTYWLRSAIGQLGDYAILGIK